VLHIVVLAAGKGTRMKSALPKVLHRAAGRPLAAYVLDAARALSPDSITIVVGYQADRVRSALARDDLTFVVQEPQQGTAHALLAAEPALAGRAGTVVLLSGDVPRLTAGTLKALVKAHEAEQAAMTVVTAEVDDPGGYGRVVRAMEPGQPIARIVEDRDAGPVERSIREINAGVYAFALEHLFDALRGVAAANAQGEYYLPDLVALYRRQGRPVATLRAGSAEEIRGVNSRKELADVSRLVRMEINDALMAAGVTLDDPATTYIEPGVQVGADTVIHPGVSIEGTTTIGTGCELHSGVRIVNSRIGDGVVVFNHSVVTDASIGTGARVGPFAHLRNGATLEADARVGNFVELKHTVLGRGSKSMHLAYLGDATIGAGVNIGAGTITCNYDGTAKQPTVIEDGAFIGSDTQLVAPVTVHKDAYVGTGTTVREDVPAGALAVSAGRQRNIEGWVEKRRRK
jgi:bifunctional UDP-N-acetylglucosamine pyrophosphorylase / glucosamine-1-phosphate N-acetyltransferase